MKRAVDKALGMFLGLVAIMAGLAIVSDLIRPYMTLIVWTLIILVSLIVLAICFPLLGRAFQWIKSGRSDWSSQ